MPGLDLDSLVGDALKTAGNIGDSISQIGNITNTITNISQDQATADKAAGDAAANIEEQKQLATQQQEASRQSIAARLHMDSTGAGYVITQQGDAVLDANARLKAASDKIAAKNSINFFDNPLGWLAGHFTVNQDIAEYNAAARDKDNAEDTATAMAKMTTDAFAVQNSLASTVNQTTIDAGKIVVAQKYNDAASQAAISGLRSNLDGITLANSASRDQLQMLFSANNAIMQDKQYKVELQRLQIASGEFDLRKQAMAEKTDEDSLVLKYIQKGFFNLNGIPMEPSRAKDALILYKSQEPNTVAFFKSGLNSFQVSPNGTKPIISLNPYDSATLFEGNKVRNLPTAQTDVGTKLVEWKREFNTPQVQATLGLNLTGLDKKGKEAALSGAFASYITRQQSLETSSVQQGSIFAPADMRLVASKNPTIANLPVWKNVLGPASTTGVDINDPNIAMGTVLAAVAAGKLSYVDAVDTNLVFAAGLHLNNQSRNFIAMGLPPVKTYNARVSVPGQLGKSTVNLVDARNVATLINKAEAARANFSHSELIN